MTSAVEETENGNRSENAGQPSDANPIGITGRSDGDQGRSGKPSRSRGRIIRKNPTNADRSGSNKNGISTPSNDGKIIGAGNDDRESSGGGGRGRGRGRGRKNARTIDSSTGDAEGTDRTDRTEAGENTQSTDEILFGATPKRIGVPRGDHATKNFTRRAMRDSIKGLSFLLASVLGAHWIIEDDETQALTDATMAYIDSMPKNAKRKNFERLMRTLPAIALVGTASVILMPRITTSVEGALRGFKRQTKTAGYNPEPTS